jgi:hypothetical protein
MPHDPKPEAHTAETGGERPDLGREPDHLAEALTGSDVGSDTRAGSLRGGSASGSEIDPDQTAINAALARQGAAATAAQPARADADPVTHTGADPSAGTGGDDVDAASG